MCFLRVDGFFGLGQAVLDFGVRSKSGASEDKHGIPGLADAATVFLRFLRFCELMVFLVSVKPF